MLNNLINDMLDLAKLESLTFKFNEEFFDLHQLINTCLEQMNFMAKKKKIQLKFNFHNHQNVFKEVN
jgi:signal transduction histidine kinase